MPKRLLNNRTVIVLLICIPVILFVSFIKPNSLESVYKVEFDRFWTLKVHSGKKYDMMILGDSRVYRGVSPQAINKVIPGISIYNFGFSSGKLNNEIYSEAEKRLDPTGRQKIILIGISPVSLIDEDNDQLHEIMKLTKAEVFDKIYTNYFLTRFTAPVKPSELFGSNPKQDSSMIKETFYDNGWVSSQTNYINHSKYIDSYRKIWETKKVSQKRLDDLYYKINEWNKKNIRVFAFRVPSSEEMDELENEQSGFNEQDCRKNISDNGGYWINIETSKRYSSYDGSHLDEKSALLLSNDIAVEINRVLN